MMAPSPRNNGESREAKATNEAAQDRLLVSRVVGPFPAYWNTTLNWKTDEVDKE